MILLDALLGLRNQPGSTVGIIITVDKAFDKNGWGHVGCFLQTLCLLAQERGLATCLQEAWSQFSDVVHAQLGIDAAREAVWCGVALGHADQAAPVNSLQTERAPLADFCAFRGFDEPARAKL